MPYARDEAGNIWETDAQGNAIRPVSHAGAPASQPGAIPLGPRKVPENPKPNLPTGWAIGPDGTAHPVAGLPTSVTNPEPKSNLPVGWEIGPDGKAHPIAGLPSHITNGDGTAQAELQAKLDTVNGLASSVADLRRQYEKNFKGKGPLQSTAEYLPALLRPANGVFNDTSNSLMADMAKAKGLTSQQFNTPAEEKMFFGPLVPNASDTDEQIQHKLDVLDHMVSSAQQNYTRQIQAVGGTPTSQKPQDNGAPPVMGTMGGAGPNGGGNGGGGLTMDDYADRTTQSAGPIKAASGMLMGPQTRQEYDTEYQKKADAMFRSGASFDQLNQFSVQSGYGGINPASYAHSRKAFDDYKASHGGREYNGYMMEAPLKTVQQTTFERAAQGIPGATLEGFANGALMGAPGAVMPDKQALAENAHPYAEMGGEALGAIAGTKGLGVVGNRLANPFAKIAPDAIAALRGSGTTATAARSLAGDVAYGTVRGGVSDPEHPVAGMLLGGVSAGGGSVLGQAAGSMLGRLGSGVTSSPTISRLRAQGVVPTLGQIMRGRAADNGGRSFVAGLEDMVSNTPGASSLVNTARNRALEQANTGAFNLRSNGTPITGVGDQAVAQLTKAKNTAYSDALDGVSVSKNDPVFARQFGDAKAYGNQWDQARGRADFGTTLNTELRPIAGNSPDLSGKQLQDSLRLLQGQQRAYTKAATGLAPDPAAGRIADAFGKVNDAFVGATARAAPDAIPKLKIANRMNHDLSILDNTAGAASKDGGVFTGSQLMDNIKSDKFGGGRSLSAQMKSPLYQQALDMHTALPNKVPPTGVNVAPWLALGGAAAGGANEESGLNSNVVRGLSLAALLSTPYTKAGSAGIAKFLLDRPETLRALGTTIRKNKGLFGSAAVPLMLESQQ